MSKSSHSTKGAAIPPPFTKASKRLDTLLGQCDPSKVYLLHVDRNAPQYKRNIFLIPVILNGTIAVLLLWRVYAVAPTYWALILSVLGMQSSASVDTASTTRKQQFLLVLRRAALMLMDFLLFRLVGPWPITFFAERPANPVWWRRKLGFQAQEVIARVSRGWNATDLMQGSKRGGESPFFKTRIAPAVDDDMVKKTGYLLMDRSWDLDFQLMLDAHTLLGQEQISTGDIDGVTLAHVESAGWCEWRWQTPNDADAELQKAVTRLKKEDQEASASRSKE